MCVQDGTGMSNPMSQRIMQPPYPQNLRSRHSIFKSRTWYVSNYQLELTFAHPVNQAEARRLFREEAVSRGAKVARMAPLCEFSPGDQS